MASSEDKKNFGTDGSTWCRGRSTARTSFGRILHTISAAPESPRKRPHWIRDEELGREIFVARNVEEEERKKGLLNIDLNVAPPEDAASESPAAAEKKASSGNEHEFDFGGVAEVVNGVCVGNTESRNRIQAHCSKGGKINGFNYFGAEAKEIENTNTVVTVSEEKMDQEMRKRRWNALLEVAENALREHEEEHGNKEENFQNQKRRIELGGELHKAAAAAETDRKKINTGQRRRSLTEWNDYGEVAAAPPVVRSARGRALAMPNKYRDTVLDSAAAEAEFRRLNRSGKSATVAPTKRKSR